MAIVIPLDDGMEAFKRFPPFHLGALTAGQRRRLVPEADQELRQSALVVAFAAHLGSLFQAAAVYSRRRVAPDCLPLLRLPNPYRWLTQTAVSASSREWAAHLLDLNGEPLTLLEWHQAERLDLLSRQFQDGN
jgi:hypothetical protein